MPAGEKNKNLRTVSRVITQLLEAHADRQSLLLCLGGGVVCDLGGFVAATYKRGIPFWHIPTTLLAMVDAGIGGKQGIDFESHKNVIGVFCPPQKIFIYPKFLQTLPPREIRNGKAEILKHALLQGPSIFKQALKSTFGTQTIPEKLLHDSARFKLQVVNKDPFESGYRKVLNFGHTIGHAVESWSLQQPGKSILHGEAVAIGIIAALYLSKKLKQFPEKEFELAIAGIRKIFPFRKLDVEPKSLLAWMRNDKKNNKGNIQFILFEKIGKPVFDIPVSDALILEAIEFYQQRHD